MLPLDLQTLFRSFLKRQSVSRDAVAKTGEVVPHQGGAALTLNAQQCWDASAVALSLLSDGISSCRPPEEWGALVGQLEPVMALAFAAGNFPQMVRPEASIFELTTLPKPYACRQPSADCDFLAPWAEKAIVSLDYASAILAAGIMRAAGEFDKAKLLINKLRSKLPEKWRASLDNEEAALAWHRGHPSEAVRLWQAQKVSVPILFNLGMASIFGGQAEEGRAPLRRAVSQLPEESPWNHLASLYLAMTEVAA